MPLPQIGDRLVPFPVNLFRYSDINRAHVNTNKKKTAYMSFSNY
nr:hypothetical protein [Proteus mirabilis]